MGQHQALFLGLSRHDVLSLGSLHGEVASAPSGPSPFWAFLFRFYLFGRWNLCQSRRLRHWPCKRMAAGGRGNPFVPGEYRVRDLSDLQSPAPDQWASCDHGLSRPSLEPRARLSTNRSETAGADEFRGRLAKYGQGTRRRLPVLGAIRRDKLPEFWKTMGTDLPPGRRRCLGSLVRSPAKMICLKCAFCLT